MTKGSGGSGKSSGSSASSGKSGQQAGGGSGGGNPMTKTDASKIQSKAAKNPDSPTAKTGFAERAQRSADKKANQ